MKVIDMHCDTLSELLAHRRNGTPEELRQNSLHVDLVRMRESHYLLQNFAMFVVLERAGDPWERMCELYRLYQEELEKNKDILAPVLRFSDIAENEAEGKLSALLTVEEGGVCKGEMEKLRELYRMGVRMITLTWNFDNEIGHPNHRTPNLTGGLTKKGFEMVAEMERLGILPDVSHLSDAGFYDVLKVTGKPFVASHSNARAICPHVRNMTDDMIRKLAGRGGVMGLNFCAGFLEEKPPGERNPGTIEAVVRHARHIADVGGIEVLGLGSDFDGIETHGELFGAQSMGNLWDAFHRAGFSEDALDRIFYGNVLRVYRETLG